MSDEPVVPGWIQEYVDACNRHDAAAVVAMMAEDVQVVDTAFGGEFTGREAVRQLLLGMDAGLSSDYRFTVRKVGLPATGKAFAIPGLTIGTRQDGAITQNRDYGNLAGFLTQVGLMPTPGQGR